MERIETRKRQKEAAAAATAATAIQQEEILNEVLCKHKAGQTEPIVHQCTTVE